MTSKSHFLTIFKKTEKKRFESLLMEFTDVLKEKSLYYLLAAKGNFLVILNKYTYDYQIRKHLPLDSIE